MQISERDVDVALRTLEDDSRAMLSAGLLSAEQVERLTAIGRATDTKSKVELVRRMTEELLKELEESNRRASEAMAEAGLQEGQTGRFLDGERFHPETRAKVKDAIEKHIADAIQQATMQAELHTGKASQPAESPQGGAFYV